MKQGHLTLHLSAAMVVLFASMPWTAAQTTQNAVGVPVSIVVTVRGSDAPKISGENVIVYQGRARAKVTDWVPLQGDRAGLELFVLLDDSRGISQGSQLEDISHFIMAQPTSTKIGVAYMQDGGPKIAQGLTTDHTLAAAALHVSLGNLATSASPYVALRDLIKQWPAGNGRREILMISSGHDEVNGDSGPGQDNIYVDSAIEEAQRAGIVVSTIGTSSSRPDLSRASGSDFASSGQEPGAPHVGLGKNHLSEVADETGGEFYYHPFGETISFAPYLDDSTHRFTRQYLLTFLAKPGKKSGMQAVRVRTDVPHATLASAEKVFVPVTRE